jgi:transposase
MKKYRRINGKKLLKMMDFFISDINASKAVTFLKLNRNTVNKYFNEFRMCIKMHQEGLKAKLKGDVEVDESFFGISRYKGAPGFKIRGRSTLKQPVFGIYERGGRVYTEVIANCKGETLIPIIRGKVSRKSIIYSDGHGGYYYIKANGYKDHKIVEHGKEFANKNCHINGIESFWSFTKRRLAKFNGVTKNFELHLKESEWRFKKGERQLHEELARIYKKYYEMLV